MNMAHSIVEVYLNSAQSTEALGECISAITLTGDVVALHGQLGSGKSTLVRGFLRRFGVTGSAASPTFNIAHVYPSTPPVYHVDAYRFKHGYEFEDTGYAEELGDNCIFLVEWAEKMHSYLPDERIDITLSHAQDGRTAIVVISTRDHATRLSSLACQFRQIGVKTISPSN